MPCTNEHIITPRLNAILPDEQKTQATHVAEVSLSEISQKLKIAHIFPRLKNNLISLRKICDGGCDIITQREKLTIKKGKQL